MNWRDACQKTGYAYRPIMVKSKRIGTRIKSKEGREWSIKIDDDSLGELDSTKTKSDSFDTWESLSLDSCYCRQVLQLLKPKTVHMMMLTLEEEYSEAARLLNTLDLYSDGAIESVKLTCQRLDHLIEILETRVES